MVFYFILFFFVLFIAPALPIDDTSLTPPFHESNLTFFRFQYNHIKNICPDEKLFEKLFVLDEYQLQKLI